MKIKFFVLLASIYLMGCAAYKELKPEPKITPFEGTYIEIKAGEKNFELKKDKKYFMKFPAPAEKNFYLVLNAENKDLMETFLTPYFDDGKGEIIRIKDESSDPLRLSYYAVDNSVQNFYWVIQSVKYDLILRMDYRYVPQWRYQFETKYTQFQETLVNNTVERTAYKGIGIDYNLEGLNLTDEIRNVSDRTDNLKLVEKELNDIARIFPASILNTTDEAYQNYRQIKAQVEEELKFQNDYLAVLTVFNKERSTRQNTAAFIEAIPEFNAFFRQKERFPVNVRDEAKRLVIGRMPEIVPHYERSLSAKQDIEPITMNSEGIQELYQLNNASVPENVSALINFVTTFNKQARAVRSVSDELESIRTTIRNYNKMPSNTYFSDIITKTSKLNYNLPEINIAAFGNYRSYTCSQKLTAEVQSLRTRINQSLDNYRAADRLVPQLNGFRDQKQYGNMIRLLNQNAYLDFLIDMYAGVDQLSIDQQAQQVRSAFYNQNWAAAETNLRSLHLDENFLKPAVMKPKKTTLVKTLEDSMFNQISSLSRQRALKLMQDNLNTLTNVEALYSDPAFLPVYDMTFSSMGTTELERKKLQLGNDLKHIKEQQFPETAIRQLYAAFVKNPDDNGVLRARAVVAHGNQYKGNDRQIRNWAAECDPWASKWITKATDYRKVFALPTNASSSSRNQYVFRLNIRIPSEAKFPVYDINIKLPKEVAQDAAMEQWYESITINKEPIKLEGRFTITAPTAANDYECQITPVRMIKDQDNILEIRFNNPKFKVYEISVMAQTPIIKKN